MKKYEFLIRYFKAEKIRLAILLVCVSLSTFLQIYSPNLISIFIDKLMINAERNTLYKIILIYIGLILINMFMSVFISWLSQIVGWNSINYLREDIVKKCINFDLNFHKGKTQGELTEIIDQDVNNLLNFFSYMGISMLCNFVLFVSVIIVYIYKNFVMGIAQSMFAVVTIICLGFIRKKGVELRKQIRNYESEITSDFSQSIECTEDITGNGFTSYVYYKFSKLIMSLLPISIRSSKIGWSMFMVTLGLQVIGYANCFIIGTILWKKNIITIGTIYVFYSYTKYILSPINEMQTQMRELQGVNASIQRIYEMLTTTGIDFSKSIDDNDTQLVYNISEDLHNSSIIFKNVYFSYDNGEYTLKNINLNIKPNQILGIIGKSGSGKTTLVSLLVNIYKPTRGEILWGNENLLSIDNNLLRSQIIYISQEVQFLNSTLRNNITFFDKSISDEDIIVAVNELEIQKIFNKFVNGLNTEIDPENLSISSGEAQVIVFLRAYIRNPQIVILDEVTSKLDPVTEKIIYDAIKRMLKGRLGIIIAHKIESIKLMDQIVVLEDGEIVKDDKLKNKEIFDDDLFSKYCSVV